MSNKIQKKNIHHTLAQSYPHWDEFQDKYFELSAALTLFALQDLWVLQRHLKDLMFQSGWFKCQGLSLYFI